MTKCYSIKLNSLISISDKCYLAKAFDGSEALIPKSQVYGQDYDVLKSDAYWITSWILDKKPELQYSLKKWSYFSKDRRNIGQIEFKHHIPKVINKKIKHDDSLIR